MSIRAWSVVASVCIPYIIFVIVIGLNESDVKDTLINDRVSNFDIEKKTQIKKPEPKKQPEKKETRRQEKLPSIKPSDIDNSLLGEGLSFGTPQFNEANFDEFMGDDLLGVKDNSVMDKSSVDTPPRIIKRSPIVYPELARKQGVSGFVSMNVLIDENGNVEDVEIVDSKPEEIFDLMADSTIRRWQFEPATYNGKRVKVWALQKIVFELN
jgi:protein TonB